MIGDSYGDGNKFEGKDSTESSIPTYLTLSLGGTDMKNLTNEELLRELYDRWIMGRMSNLYDDEIRRRLARVSELEAENEVLREMNLGLNASSIAGKKAVEKLERIRNLDCVLNQTKCNMVVEIIEILEEEG